jgi:hypothetical protein
VIVEEIPQTAEPYDAALLPQDQEPGLEGAERSVLKATARSKGRDLARENAVRQAKRRSEGMMPREQWLERHKTPPWAGTGLSKSAFYRRQKSGKGVA